MKASTSKAVRSPGRTDKYPPPLMRFLRSNVGSRSRGRSSRATSLFMRRRMTTAIEAQQQEPSSPKVTCIGQVRVRRSSKSKSKPTSSAAAGNRFCPCNSFHVVSLCRLRPRWRKWVSFFHSKNIRVRTDSSKRRPAGGGGEEHRKSSARESSCRVYGSDSSGSPPKNALLLARCRSAPHRSSYLASRVWGSPGETTTAAETEQNPKQVEEEEVGIDGSNHPETSTMTPSTQDSKIQNAVVLRRSKSEPARRSGDPLTTTF